MKLEITDNGASIKIVTDEGTRLIYKPQVREIVLIKNNVVKVDLGLGSLQNLFISHPEVTLPIVGTPEELRDLINDMLKVWTPNGATEQKQDDTIGKVDKLLLATTTMQTALDQLSDRLRGNPNIVDQSVPGKVYQGYSEPGKLTSDAAWAVSVITSANNITVTQWADGNKNFDNIWDNRDRLIYS